MEVSKFPKLGFLQLWGVITLCIDLRLKWGLKKSCSPHQDLSNSMSHATFTQKNLVDSWLLVAGNQTTKLTIGLSFGHNLCLKCPNGSCEPILDSYVSIVFQWYKELFNPLGFDPCDHSLKILKVHRDSKLQKWKLPWECEGSFPHTFLHSWAFSWPATLQALALGASPKLGLRQPKNVLIKTFLLIKTYTFYK